MGREGEERKGRGRRDVDIAKGDKNFKVHQQAGQTNNIK